MAVYACADLHGRYDLFTQIKEFLKPEDKVYVLGDCGDRGPRGWDIIKEVYENPQFLYLKGNHEELLVEAMEGDTSLCFLNGGKKTYTKWKYKDGAPRKWIKKLKNLPYSAMYINKNGKTIFLTHAGFTPKENCFPEESDALWDRTHFNDDWPEDQENYFIIHGHTPCSIYG